MAFYATAEAHRHHVPVPLVRPRAMRLARQPLRSTSLCCKGLGRICVPFNEEPARKWVPIVDDDSAVAVVIVAVCAAIVVATRPHEDGVVAVVVVQDRHA